MAHIKQALAVILITMSPLIMALAVIHKPLAAAIIALATVQQALAAVIIALPPVKHPVAAILKPLAITFTALAVVKKTGVWGYIHRHSTTTTCFSIQYRSPV
ncbi:MAG: hypothetical protein JNM68_17630 [Dinghuibacter sp.]|nr:hypothetical protein [Dinghuibacter sp.]